MIRKLWQSVWERIAILLRTVADFLSRHIVSPLHYCRTWANPFSINAVIEVLMFNVSREKVQYYQHSFVKFRGYGIFY